MSEASVVIARPAKGPLTVTYTHAEGFIVRAEGEERAVYATFLTLLRALDFLPSPEEEEAIWRLPHLYDLALRKSLLGPSTP